MSVFKGHEKLVFLSSRILLFASKTHTGGQFNVSIDNFLRGHYVMVNIVCSSPRNLGELGKFLRLGKLGEGWDF